MSKFHRAGSASNDQDNIKFKNTISKLLSERLSINLEQGIKIPIGLDSKKLKEFDLGSLESKVLVLCKSHTWTETGNVPSAKLNVFLNDMYSFHLAPKEYKKIFVILKDVHKKRGISLGEYYVTTKDHMIPRDVDFYELDQALNELKLLRKGK